MRKKYTVTENVGRPSKKDTLDFTMLKTLASFGLTDAQLASVFRVTEQTICNWKKDENVFLALKDGKNIADAMVKRSLFERAMGYSHSEEKIFQHEGQIIRAQTIKYYPPDSTALIFWLKNRQPDQWRENQTEKIIENHYHINITKKDLLKKNESELIFSSLNRG